MAAPVWLLSVDLQAKTATFETGLAQAAKSARGAFNDIKSGAGEMGGHVGTNMFEARHAIMLMGDELGGHLPRGVTAFLTSLGPVGPALEAAFPFLAIVVGATLLLEHLTKLQEEGVKLTEDQLKFGTAVQEAFNTLDQKLLQSGIRADELKNDHLGALKKQLELIDHQSMAELVHAFDEVAKAALPVMEDLKTSWYSFDAGSQGAKHALEDFQNQYHSLLALGNDKGASDLLAGTLDSAKKVLALQREAAKEKPQETAMGTQVGGNIERYQNALTGLKILGATADEKSTKAQEQLVEALSDQVKLEQRVAELKKQDSANASRATGNDAAAQAAAAARSANESMLRLGEQNIAAARASANAELTIHRASLEARLASDIEFAGRERDTQLAANTAELAGLDRAAKDYQNQVKANKEKALEITNEYSVKVAELTAKTTVAAYTRDLQATEQSEREKIEATQQGSIERLIVINEAIQSEQAANLQDTNFFRELQTMRIEMARRAEEEEAKLRAAAAKEAAASTKKMGELTIAAEKQQMALANSEHRVTAQQRMDQETKIAKEEFDNKMKAARDEAAGLNKTGEDYENKLAEMQNREKQLVQEHANELAAIKLKAEEESNARIISAENQRNDAIARGLTQSITGHQTWAKMLTNMGDQVVSGMLQNVIKSMLIDDMDRERDAARAARKAFNIGISIGGPVGLILGPTFGATAYATVMAFNHGTDAVPGVGNQDTVMSALTPGEGVVPGGVMDGLSKMARAGGFEGRGTTNHVHFHPTYNIHTIDGDGMEAALEKNREQVTRHIEHSLRRMNK